MLPSWKPSKAWDAVPPSATVEFDARVAAAPTLSALKLRLEVTVVPMFTEPAAFSVVAPTLRTPPPLTVTGPVKLPVPDKASVPRPLTVRPVPLVTAPVKAVVMFKIGTLIVRTPAPRSKAPKDMLPTFTLPAEPNDMLAPKTTLFVMTRLELATMFDEAAAPACTVSVPVPSALLLPSAS